MSLFINNAIKLARLKDTQIKITLNQLVSKNFDESESYIHKQSTGQYITTREPRN